jgi:hypothetical protein
VAVLLHAAWDASQGIAVWLTLLFAGTPRQRLLIELGDVPRVSQTQVHLFTVLSWALLTMDGLVGLLILRGRWRRATATPAILVEGRP